MGTPDQSAWVPSGRPELHTFVPRERRAGPLLLWIATLVGALALLVWLGGGELASPDLTAPSTWSDWAAARGTATVVVAALRIVALGLAWYLVGVTSVSVLAHAARAARLVRIADALSIGPVRVVVQQALGVSLAVGVVATALPPHAFGSGVGPMTVVTAQSTELTVSAVPVEDASDETAEAAPTATPHDPAVLAGTIDATVPVPAPTIVVTPPSAVPTDPADEAAVDGGGQLGGTGVAADERADATSDAVTATDGRQRSTEVVADAWTGREVRVEAGDHLWGIAEEDLRRVLGREPDQTEVVDHWRRVIEANRERLVVPSNPDLLHPGQRIVMPDVEVSP